MRKQIDLIEIDRIISYKSSRLEIPRKREIDVRSIWHRERMRLSRSFVCFAYILPFHCAMIKRSSHKRTSLFIATPRRPLSRAIANSRIEVASYQRVVLLQNLPRALCAICWPTFSKPPRLFTLVRNFSLTRYTPFSVSSIEFFPFFSPNFLYDERFPLMSEIMEKEEKNK